MAVVKANFVKRGRGAKAQAKATLRYIQHRPGKDGERVTRRLFGPDGVLDRQQAYRIIDEAKQGTRFFRIVLSPDPRLEDTRRDLDLWTLTIKIMELFEEKLKHEKRLHGGLPWFAVEHADHSRSRHLHLMLLFRGKLRRDDIAALRQLATDVALAQRLERDLAVAQQQHQQEQPLPSFPDQRGAFVLPTRGTWQPQAKPLPTPKPCPTCGELLVVFPGAAVQCHTCGARLSRHQLAPGYEEAAWG